MNDSLCFHQRRFKFWSVRAPDTMLHPLRSLVNLNWCRGKTKIYYALQGVAPVTFISFYVSPNREETALEADLTSQLNVPGKVDL
jgi:hypothetical protein